MPVSTDDYVSVSDFLGRYCWAVDAGDEEGWAALWASDGVFTGVSAEPHVGHEALKSVPRGVRENQKCRVRHTVGSLWCEYEGAGRDTVLARYYNSITYWPGGGGQLMCHADSTMRLRRHGATWLIERNDTVLLG